jgi:ABC-2 type transport system ATP-binding protein
LDAQGNDGGGNTGAIEAENLLKVYPGGIRAVDGVSFSVTSGEIFGLLGPNGAGKTTAIKMMIGIIKPTSGSLRVLGVNVVKSPREARRVLGYVPQSVSVDGDLSGYENLLIFSRLSYVSRADRRERIQGALEYVGLDKRADDLVKHYSGGMMRRLEIAQALVNRPKVLFLDEPAIGLDPASRRQIWESIKRLRTEFGTTLLITTHDMSEADFLCDRVAIMDSGKMVVMGSPLELKRSLGGDVVTTKLANPRAGATITVPPELGQTVQNDGSTIKVLTPDGQETAPRLVIALRDEGVEIESISIDTPSLDDVFLKYTKRRLEEPGDFAEARAERRSIARHAR